MPWSFLGGLLGGLFNAIGNFFLGWIRDDENQKLGEEKQVVADERSAKAESMVAGAARDAASRSTDTPDGLRKYEQSDPNNRDNA